MRNLIKLFEEYIPVVEAECLSPVLHHQLLHARVGQAYHQEQLSKLLTVVKQIPHDAKQLLLETSRQEP